MAADGVYLNELSDKLQANYVGWQGALCVVVGGVTLRYMAGRTWKETMGIITPWMV
jgi:hypothetical protein